MIPRALKIFSIAYLIGGLLTWAGDIYGEARYYRDDYYVISAMGQRRFDSQKFVWAMVDHAIPCILIWPAMVYLSVSLRMGWTCKSAELGRC